MRARELMSSVGAGGSLVAAGILCLLLFTSLLTFRGWPEAAPANPDGSASLRTPPAKADGLVASGPVFAAAAPAPAASPAPADRPRPRRARPAPPAPGGDAAPAAPVTPVAEAPAQPAAPAQPPAGRTPPRPAAPAPAQPAPAPAPAPGPVESVTDMGRDVLQPVVEPLPPVVHEPVGEVLDVVDGVAQTADDTLAPLLP